MYRINIIRRLLSYLNRKILGPVVKIIFLQSRLSEKYRILDTNSSAIGHLCADIDCFLMERSMKKLKFRGILLAPRRRTANNVIVEIWADQPGLCVVQNRLLCYALDYLRTYNETGFDCTKYCAVDGKPAEAYRIYKSIAEDTPLVSFRQSQNFEGKKLFETIFSNLDPTRIVVLHSRDSVYDKSNGNKNYCTQNYRNGDIESFVEILDYLRKRGYSVIRIGEYEKTTKNTKWPLLELPRLTHEEEELINVYLASICALFLGSASGASQLAVIWRRPVFLINVLPYSLLRPHISKSMAIPKLLSIGDRTLSVKEIFTNGYHWYRDDISYVNNDIQIKSNASNDCLADFDEFFKAYVEYNYELRSELKNDIMQIKYRETCASDSYDYMATSLVPRHFFTKHNLINIGSK